MTSRMREGRHTDRPYHGGGARRCVCPRATYVSTPHPSEKSRCGTKTFPPELRDPYPPTHAWDGHPSLA